MRIFDFATKKLKVEDGDVELSVKLSVENQTDDEDVYVTVKGLDAEGFEVLNFIMDGKVSIGATKTLTTIESYIDEKLFRQIRSWEFEA